MSRDDAKIGEIARQIGYQLRRVDMLAMAELQDEFAKLGVAAGRATAVIFIGLNPGSDQTELGRMLGINRASTMATVNNLVALGAVERRPGRDRRSNALHLTPAGEHISEEITRIANEHDASFFKMLNSDERAELFRILLKIRDFHGVSASEATPKTKAILRRVK
jgi:DNA-binding MarR family transcriptional regulator